jgi:hypothetical protein
MRWLAGLMRNMSEQGLHDDICLPLLAQHACVP